VVRGDGWESEGEMRETIEVLERSPVLSKCGARVRPRPSRRISLAESSDWVGCESECESECEYECECECGCGCGYECECEYECGRDMGMGMGCLGGSVYGGPDEALG
jgi:hypothetical protein